MARDPSPHARPPTDAQSRGPGKGKQGTDWVSRVADEVEARVTLTKGPGAPIVCASGISPSGSVHLGNMRELMTTHLVAEELKSRGREVTHLHSWDDFDRLRKVPLGLPQELSPYVGCPLSEIPDPKGELDSWATRFIGPVEAAAARLGISCRWVRQSQNYRSGVYRDGIRRALRARTEIFDILEQYRTAKLQERPVEERRAAAWPLQVYCQTCNHDSTEVLGWDEPSDVVTYTCKRCGPAHFRISDERLPCKLPWKADWPMRWAFEGVDFEPGGEDHSTPGGSFTVGTEVVRRIFGGAAPHYVGYGFVGMAGRTKISSSAGTDATPEFALRFIEPALLRFLYIRRTPGTAFTIDFGQDIWRQYDEWDALQKKAAAGAASPADARWVERCLRTSAGEVAAPTLLVPFRLISTSADMTSANTEQILRIVAAHLESPPEAAALQAAIEPRLTCAAGWIEHCLPDDERLHVRSELDPATLTALDEQTRRGLSLLVASLAAHWSLAGLSDLVYGVPKTLLGLPQDTEPTAELKALQRAFFVAIYQLILGSDTGPRLPTLFLSLGQDRLRALLGGAA